MKDKMANKHPVDVHNIEPQARDITEGKQSQDASALLSAIVDSSDDAIISKDLNTIITSWNKGAERLFGYTAAEAIGRPITMIIPPDRLDEEPKIIERLKRGERVDHFETIRMRKDGSHLDISLTISPVKDSNGEIVGASKVARDITERKQLERQRQDFNRQLEKMVSERTAELRQANHALLQDMKERERLEEQLRQSQKLESLGVLAAGVAHDLNNMLNIIQGYTAVLNPETPAEEIEESVETILETTSRGVALVKQLLTLAQKRELKTEPVEVNTLIQGLSSLFKGTFPKHIEVTLDLAPAPLWIMADESQITQVLVNLCVNARDAMPDGGTLQLKTGVVDVSELKIYGGLGADGYVSIDIADTGTGINESIQSRIFEPFFTTKEVGKGTGLGLSVAYGIVKSHNGLIDVESEQLHGTTFHLYFPVVSSPGNLAGSGQK
jgi:PAS domain S-box-containing protein